MIINTSNRYNSTEFLTYFMCNKNIMTAYFSNQSNSHILSVAPKTNENIVVDDNTDSQVTYKIYCYYIN